MYISNKSFLLVFFGIFATMPCHAIRDTPSSSDLNEQMSSLNKRIRFYFKCLRHKCSIEERNAALKAVFKDATILALLVTGIGFTTKYALHRYRQAPAEIFPTQKILTNIESQDYPISFATRHGDQVTIDRSDDSEILYITLKNSLINYTGISYNLNMVLSKIFSLESPHFNTILVQLQGKDKDLAYRFNRTNNKWEQASRAMRKKNELYRTF